MRQRQEPKIYHNQVLMDNTNDMFVRIKTHLLNLGDDNFKTLHPKPTGEELDLLMSKLFEVLRKDCEPMRKY